MLRSAAFADRCGAITLVVRDYDLVADPYAIEYVAGRVRERLEPSLPQTELFPPALAGAT